MYFLAIPFDTIKELLDNRRADILVNVMTGYINRFKKVVKNWSNLDRLYGGEEWREILDENMYSSPKERADFLVHCYENNLKEKAGAMYTLSFRMKGLKNVLIYHLVFATHNLKGLSKYASLISLIIHK